MTEPFLHYPSPLDWIEHLLAFAGAFGWGWLSAVRYRQRRDYRRFSEHRQHEDTR